MDASKTTLKLRRMGDFYEFFGNDAVTASKTLGLTITTRMKKGESPLPMAGFPYHQLDCYLAKLQASGFAVEVA